MIERPADLHAYLAGVVNGLGMTSLQIGGVADHVHILAGFSPQHRLSDLVREIKKSSSIWMQARQPRFRWQTGCAAFAVSEADTVAVSNYICNQEGHHRNVDSRQELLDLLRECGIEPDPRFFS